MSSRILYSLSVLSLIGAPAVALGHEPVVQQTYEAGKRDGRIEAREELVIPPGVDAVFYCKGKDRERQKKATFNDLFALETFENQVILESPLTGFEPDQKQWVFESYLRLLKLSSKMPGPADKNLEYFQKEIKDWNWINCGGARVEGKMCVDPAGKYFQPFQLRQAMVSFRDGQIHFLISDDKRGQAENAGKYAHLDFTLPKLLRGASILERKDYYPTGEARGRWIELGRSPTCSSILAIAASSKGQHLGPLLEPAAASVNTQAATNLRPPLPFGNASFPDDVPAAQPAPKPEAGKGSIF